MAEAADILSGPHQTVMLPNMAAGCSMADMADPEDVYAAWQELEDAGVADKVVPVTYMNSAASPQGVLRPQRRHRLHLQQRARRPALGLRARREGALLPRPAPRPQHRRQDGHPSGAHAPLELQQALRQPRRHDPRAARAGAGHPLAGPLLRAPALHRPADRGAPAPRHPGVHVIVHPECRLDVVQAADSSGSTEFIVQTIAKGAPGSAFAVGTEINLVNRLAHENPDKTVFCLDPVVCPCSTMYRIHPAYLAWTVEELAKGHVVNRVAVDADTAHYAKIALDRMLTVV